MRAAVFISYRRVGETPYAGWLRSDLAHRLGEDQIFMDLGMSPGVDWVQAIEEAIGGCRVFLALIGPQWGQVKDASGAPRIMDPSDVVHIELRTALQRPDVLTIPILVNGAKMPREVDLPDDLKPFARRNAHVLNDTGWPQDFAVLVDALVRAGVEPVKPKDAFEGLDDLESLGVDELDELDAAVDWATLVERLTAGGIVYPNTIAGEAASAGLPLPLACALVEKASGGGHNVFGNDPTIFAGAGAVTRAKYEEYKRQRVASGNRLMQGVGPCQLTWWALQDEADREGGCWRPRMNMRVAFRHLAGLVKTHGEDEGVPRFYGAGPAATASSRDLLEKAAVWTARLS